jgi:kynurenine formamidase
MSEQVASPRTFPTADEAAFRAKVRGLRRWGRWGDDDQRGTVNLVTPEKIVEAAGLVRLGLPVSLARPFPVAPAANNPNPAEHYLRRRERGEHGEGSVTDYAGVNCHGKATTHLDALCHVWNHDGMWNGRSADDVVTGDGVTFGDIEQFADGITTRGVLLDVPAYRDVSYVEWEEQITGAELDAVARAGGIDVRPGDALVIHGGREAWDRAHPRPWGAPDPDGVYRLPGLHASCLDYFHDTDCSLIVWDMMDAVPNEYGVPHCTHAAIFALGLPLLDNALIEPLTQVCRRENRTDFLLTVAPLRIVGGTGSPVNPIALL